MPLRFVVSRPIPSSQLPSIPSRSFGGHSSKVRQWSTTTSDLWFVWELRSEVSGHHLSFGLFRAALSVVSNHHQFDGLFGNFSHRSAATKDVGLCWEVCPLRGLGLALVPALEKNSKIKSGRFACFCFWLSPVFSCKVRQWSATIIIILVCLGISVRGQRPSS